ncbi:AB hydrolase-1 domain-containing protein [Durusdinium trenchii]|uniref:AB hydrolase-1 domain-containing protein n=1 Tax=Durusdinium trenchii TaxID=1381693 RepID=A0ABP0QQI9_9DINO
MKMPNALRPALRRFSSNAQHLDQESDLRSGWPFSGVAHLSDLLPVVRYDARGHGRSADAIEPTWPVRAPRAMGSDLCKMHEKMFPKGRIILGGTSMGAAASLYAALEAPEKVEALVLATPPTAWETRKKFVPLYQESLALAEKQGLEAAKSVAETKARPPIFLETERGRASFDIGWRQKFSMGQRRYCAALRGAIDSDLPSPEALRRSWVKIGREILPQAELCVADSWEEIERFPEQIRGFLLNLL